LALVLALPAAALVRGDDGLVVTFDGRTLVGAAAAFENGTLASSGDAASYPLDVAAPDGYWATVHGGVALVVQADGASNAALQVLDASGAVVKTGVPSGLGGAMVQTTGPSNDTVALLRDVPNGAYTVRVTSSQAPLRFTILAQREVLDAQPPRELLPDLVVLPIHHVSDVWQATKAGVSCRPLEVAESVPQPPVRCLRFDTTVGDVGEGALLLAMTQQQAVGGLVCSTQACPTTALQQDFAQQVERTDGTFASYDVSPAVYHAGHNHYHISDFVHNTLYAYDLATRTRGAPVGTGHKDGFCPIDDGLITLGDPSTQEPAQSTCYVNGGDITIHLEANYYDTYPSSIDDQYVDITNVPPGVYELVTVVNRDGVIHESDATDNENSVLVRITANGACALEECP
jgi:hypothetical protein